jgi:hypothetical protein
VVSLGSGGTYREPLALQQDVREYHTSERPYVWNPNQVILLVDSLLRG